MSSERAVMHPDDECRPIGLQLNRESGTAFGVPIAAIPPSPPQPKPGDTVLVEAVVDRTGDASISRYGNEIITVRISSLANDHICVMPASAIHPAPTAAKKGEAL